MNLSHSPISDPNTNLHRPRWSRFDVTTTILDFAIVSYAVDPARLASLLPESFEPRRFTFSDGSRHGLVSAVSLRNWDFRVGAAPAVRYRFPQLHYRAYVRHRDGDEDEEAAWFFDALAGARYPAVPRRFLGLPLHHADLHLETDWVRKRCRYYHLETDEPWGRSLLDMEGTTELLGGLEGFASGEQARETLAHPLTSYFACRNGRIGELAVWYEALSMREAVVHQASFPFFEELGLVEAGATPHSALVYPAFEMIVFMPPRTLHDGSGR